MESNKRTIFLFSFFLILQSFSLNAQSQKYFIYFSDKNKSAFSLSDPSKYLSARAIQRRAKQNISVTLQDIPVNPCYVDSLVNRGVQVLFTSRWFNAALVIADPAVIAAINDLSFVNRYSHVSRKLKVSAGHSSEMNLAKASVGIDYGSSYNQVNMIGVDEMHAEGLNGEGVLIAVLDAGFMNANTLPVFDSLFTNNRVIATYDFVDDEVSVYENDAHGTHVLSILASYSPGALIGTAYKADYLLLRTEDGSSESIGEELNWIKAAEYADSAGADIINSSLGYNTFDDPSANHAYSDLDGNTTPITQAADIAASKGILVVNSAGNEGGNSWKHILAPADGDSVLAVGAVTPSGNYFYLSSIGPSADGRIKPDVSAQGNLVIRAVETGGTATGNGTSFAAPLISGLAAGIWQAYPYLTNMELLQAIQRSSSIYLNPNEMIGYGIPNFRAIKELIRLNANGKRFVVFPNPVEEGPLVINFEEEEVGKEVTITAYDILGRFVAEEKITAAYFYHKLNIDWAKGIYFLNIATSHRNQKIKILKY